VTPETASVIVATATVVNTFLSLVSLIFVNMVRHNTNSLKDELVASTAKASDATGHAAGLQQGRDEYALRDKSK